MEWLGHIIHAEIDDGKWNPIRLSRLGLILSHLLFVNDLVIFCKVELEQAYLLKGILKHFCEFSRHDISARKVLCIFPKELRLIYVFRLVSYLGFRKFIILRFI